MMTCLEYLLLDGRQVWGLGPACKAWRIPGPPHLPCCEHHWHSLTPLDAGALDSQANGILKYS